MQKPSVTPQWVVSSRLQTFLQMENESHIFQRPPLHFWQLNPPPPAPSDSSHTRLAISCCCWWWWWWWYGHRFRWGNVDDAEHSNPTVEEADVQKTSVGVETHPAWLLDDRSAYQVPHVDQVWIKQDNTVVVTVQHEGVAEHVDGNTLWRVQTVWARTVRSSVRP